MRFLGSRVLWILTLWLRAAGGQELEEDEDLFIAVDSRNLPEAACESFDGAGESHTDRF